MVGSIAVGGGAASVVPGPVAPPASASGPQASPRGSNDLNGDAALIAEIAPAAIPLAETGGDHDPLLDLIGDAHWVLIGDASHGTHEFYRERAEITRRLIEEHGFTVVAVEAPWPEAHRANRFVHGWGDDGSAERALEAFEGFPAWMWRNTDVRDFLEWMRGHNAEGDADGEASFYGLDVYSLGPSMDAVVEYLDDVDPEAADRARTRYACLEPHRDAPERYGGMVAVGEAEQCEDEVVAQLDEMEGLDVGDPNGDAEERAAAFSAIQNARVVRNAERFYRGGTEPSWNVRDRHMAETLEKLAELHSAHEEARVVVWAHNSHVGDARATMFAEIGQLNIGELVREEHGDDVFLIGTATDHGTVIAAPEWGRAPATYTVRPALEGSWEALLHGVAGASTPNFMLPLGAESPPALEGAERLERAIGVIYRPDTERYSHYFEARLAEQFDAVLYFDESSALTPLGESPGVAPGSVSEGPPTCVMC